mgnify:CR=1 FL=1
MPMRRLDEAEIQRLRDALEQMPAGEFHFPQLYGPDWDDLWIGDKVLRLGRDFLEAVRGGAFPGVSDTGRKKGGGRVYLLRP